MSLIEDIKDLLLVAFQALLGSIIGGVIGIIAGLAVVVIFIRVMLLFGN